ncbi:uncharacterized protein LOC125455766 isoform X2 [Stegostoma tigrinum]|uniref:uncharacterized protein LOC125455766 isoform X2 n=1 Tax=Stegostoma tigrinum TaxID=3053191 RepID=UPI00202AF0D1|nr:uncharacterized protein LOC125455766 isoform X2 [Stegostoma tigrinum]
MEQKPLKDSDRTRSLIPILLMPSPSKTSSKCRSSSLPRNIKTVPAAKLEKIRTQSNHTELQRVNQDLEKKLHRMVELHEEEKRNVSHEVTTLCNQLMEAKITINKLLGSKLPAEVEERIHAEKCGYNTPGTDCLSSFFDTEAELLHQPEPIGSPGSAIPVSPSRKVTYDHLNNTNKPDQRSPCKSNLYHSDTALYCPAEQRDRRQVRNAHFLKSQSFTDSCTEAEGFDPTLASEMLLNYDASTPSSSDYPSSTVTAVKKGTSEAKPTFCPTQQVGLRDDIHERKYNTSERQENRKCDFIQTRPLQQFTDVTLGCKDGMQQCSVTLPIEFSDTPHLSWFSTKHVTAPKLYNDQENGNDLEKNRMCQLKKVNMHFTNTSSHRISGSILSNDTEQQWGSRLVKETTRNMNQLFIREDYFPDGKDSNKNAFTDAGFGAMNCKPLSEIDHNYQESSSTPSHIETEDSPKKLPSEKNKNKTYIKNTNTVSNIKRIVDVASNTSVKSSYRRPIKFLKVHDVPLDDVVSSSKQEKPLKISGLYRKDSLIKAQLYGNLLK